MFFQCLFPLINRFFQIHLWRDYDSKLDAFKNVGQEPRI